MSTWRNCLLSWTWYVLAGREDIEQKLLAELAGAKSAPPAELIERLPYMQNVLNEALRLYPPAYAFGRRAVLARGRPKHRLLKFRGSLLIGQFFGRSNTVRWA